MIYISRFPIIKSVHELLRAIYIFFSTFHYVIVKVICFHHVLIALHYSRIERFVVPSHNVFERIYFFIFSLTVISPIVPTCVTV